MCPAPPTCGPAACTATCSHSLHDQLTGGACGCLRAGPAVLQGTSRGGANIKEIVRRIDLWGLDMVFVVGGNGGNAAANAIQVPRVQGKG